ncbi:hypothetical protein [Methylobacterium oryzisoli]|uniref:hypothetical protein n=1 Tax=Methylobacterium oryzisoli TaxID=3385502 RepID=UPI003892CBC5
MSHHQNRDDIVRALAGALDVAAHRLTQGGASDLEVGRAMVAAGLSRWARAIPAEQLVDELATITGGIAVAAGIDVLPDAVQ